MTENEKIRKVIDKAAMVIILMMLARAVYKNARFLILDEPTAALDALAEAEMYEKYDALLKGKTSMFISHRLASTKYIHGVYQCPVP